MATVEITTENFASIIERPGIVVLDLWAAWCGPCRSFAPIFQAASERHPGVTFGKVDTEAQPQIAAALGVRAIPTVAVFRDGVLVFSQAGMLPPNVLDELVKKVSDLDMEEVHKHTHQQSSADAGE
jgi:thioredoxin 1